MKLSHRDYWLERVRILRQRLGEARDPVVKQMLHRCILTAEEAARETPEDAAEVPTRDATRTRSCLATGPCDP